MSRYCPPLLVLLSLAGAASAQLTEAQANAQLKAAIKQAKKDHAASVGQRAKAAIAAIDAFTAAAPTGAGAAFADLFEAMETFQNGLFDDFRLEQAIVMDAAVDLLQEYSGGSDLLGVYPEPFYLGTGGPLDDLRAAMNVAQSKALAKVRKKLDKAAAKLAKTSNARLTVFMEPATRQGDNAFVQDAITAYTGFPLVIHTALALGFADSADSGTIMVGGFGDDAAAIEVSAIHEGAPQQAAAEFFELGSPFWHATFGAGGEGMPDGNVLVHAQQGLTGQSFGAYVSVK